MKIQSTTLRKGKFRLIAGVAIAICASTLLPQPASAAGGTAFNCAAEPSGSNQYLVGQGTQAYLGLSSGFANFKHTAYATQRNQSCLGTQVSWNRVVVQNSAWRNGAAFLTLPGVGCDNQISCNIVANWATSTPGSYANIATQIGRRLATTGTVSFGIIPPGTTCSGTPLSSCV
jgi:hypothetical protein